MPLKSLGSLLLTTTLGLPHFTIFSLRIVTRDLITSLLTNNDCGDINPAIKVDFPPGAAQTSNICSGFLLSVNC